MIDLKKINEAKKILSQITDESKNKHFVKVLYLEGILKKTKNDYDEAITIFRQCLEIDKKFINAHIALASIYSNQNNFSECINLLNEVLRIDSRNSKAFLELGIIYSHLGEIKKGISLLKNSLDIDPFNYEIKYNLAQMQIYNKEFEEGWNNFQSRWLYHNFNSIRFKSSKKQLTNLNELKNILIWSEQGIGDQIMYGSIFSEISNLSKNVIVKLDKRLIKIFERKHKHIKFIDNEAIIKEDQYDVHLPFGDLGYLFRKDLKSFKKANFPYISINSKISSKVKSVYNSENKIIVGISWTSKNKDVGKNKSINLERFLPILKLKNLTFLDLEYENSDKDRNTLFENTRLKIQKFKDIDYYNDIIGVASIIDACDLIITCSNVNAHISGALGKKTFLLLPLGKGRLWNWNAEQDKSIWYPSVKIFQQIKYNDWTHPIKNIKTDILSLFGN